MLACTHYPLLLDRFRRLAPWPVTYIDPAPAIARRVDAVLTEEGFLVEAHPITRAGASLFTSGQMVDPALAATLARFGARPAIVPLKPRRRARHF